MLLTSTLHCLAPILVRSNTQAAGGEAKARGPGRQSVAREHDARPPAQPTQPGAESEQRREPTGAAGQQENKTVRNPPVKSTQPGAGPAQAMGREAPANKR